MKKGMIKFLATGMTALTLMGTAVAFSPATQVFAAETETMDEASDSTHEIKTMSVKEADNYVKELVGNTAPCQEYDNTKMYRVGNKVYSFSFFEQEPEIIKECLFNCSEHDDHKIEQYYNTLVKRGMINGEFYRDGDYTSNYYCIRGIIPKVNLVINIYEKSVPVETVKITADNTMVRPGQCAILQLQVNEGADASSVNWRVMGAEDTVDFYADGNQAIVTGYETGTVMVVAETEDGVRDFIHINIVDF